MKRTEIPSVDDPRIMIGIGPIPVKGRKPLTLRVPRFDFLDPDTYDELMADVDALDVEAELIAVANDLDETPVGTAVYWQPLLKATRARLAELGVKVKRLSDADQKRDEVTAPSEDVLDALRPYSAQAVVPLHKRMRNVRLTMLKHVVTPAQLEVCKRLATGQLNEIWDQWQAESNVSLGEFLASASSSQSIRGQSTSTSSNVDTADGTSDGASDGEISETS